MNARPAAPRINSASQAARAAVIQALPNEGHNVRTLAVDWLLGKATFFGQPDQAKVGLLLTMSGVDTYALNTLYNGILAQSGEFN